MFFDITFVLIVAATAAGGLLAGASLNQSIKQYRRGTGSGWWPTRSTARASDLGPGVLWYAILGVGLPC